MKRLLQVCFIAAMVFGLASCTKEDNNANGGNGSTSTPTSLVGTEWTWNNGSISFTTATDAIVTIYNYHQGRKTGVFPATYTYSNGSGELKMTIDGQPMTIQFTVSGNTLTAKGTPDGDVTATRANNNPQPGPNSDSSLVGSQWVATDGEARITVTFTSGTETEVIVVPPSGVTEHYYGTYTYSNGNGTMNLTVESQPYTINFTINGNIMMAYNTPAGDITFTRDGGGNPQPGPNPGGDYPLNNTAWQSSFTDGDVDVTMTVAFGTTNCTMEMYVNGYPDDQAQGTYTYSGTTTSGQGTITFNGEVATFVVNGNEASVTAEGETHVFVRIRK